MNSKRLGKIIDGLASNIQWGILFGKGTVKDGKLVALDIKCEIVRRYHSRDTIFRQNLNRNDQEILIADAKTRKD